MTAVLELLRSTGLENSAVMKKSERVTNTPRAWNIVSNDHKGCASITFQVCEKIVDLDRRHWIETAARFINQKNARIHGHRARKADPLLHPAGYFARHLTPVLFEPDLIQQFSNLLRNLGFSQSGMPAQRKCNVLSNRNGVKQCRILKQKPDLFAKSIQTTTIDLRQILTINKDAAGIGLNEADHLSKRNALAGSAASQNTKRCVPRHVERNLVQNFDAVEAFAHAIETNRNIHGH